MTEHQTLIKQLFEFFNGNMSDEQFRLITHKDYHFQTNLGSNFPREDAIHNLNMMRFFVSTQIHGIGQISEHTFEVKGAIEVVDLEINFYQTIPTITEIYFEDGLIKNSNIQYVTTPEIITVLKTVRAKSLVASIDAEKSISQSGSN